MRGTLNEASLHLVACPKCNIPSNYSIKCRHLWSYFSHHVSVGPDSWLLHGEPPARPWKLPCCVSQPAETGEGIARLWAARWRWTGLQEEWHHHCVLWHTHRHTQTKRYFSYLQPCTHTAPIHVPCVFFFLRSSHRRMNIVGLESSMGSEVCASLCINTHCCHLDNWFFIIRLTADLT